MTVDAPSPAGGLFAPGAIFARRYRLVHRLRSGPVTDVWRADDLVEHTSVAVEIVVAEDDARKQDILQQIDIARGLTHPGICRVFDAGEAEGRIYCSLELVDGENLHTVFRRAGRLPPEKVADIGRQLCRALAALHAAGSRTSIDPWTVLLDGSGAIRIADLGFGLRADAPPGVNATRRATEPSAVRT